MDDDKSLDLFAVLLLVISVLLVLLAVLLRSYFNDLALQQRIESVSGYDGVWVALPDELVWLPDGKANTASKKNLGQSNLNALNATQGIRLTKESLNLETGTENSIVTMSFIPTEKSTHLWLRTMSSGVSHCEIKIQSPASVQIIEPCQLVINNPENYKNIVALAQSKQLLTVDNFTANIDKYDGITGEKIKTNIAYETPQLSGFEQLPLEMKELVNTVGGIDGMQIGKLYRANQGLVANNIFETNNSFSNYFVQANTGARQLISWKLDEQGVPVFGDIAESWIDTNGQPYFFGYLKHPNVETDKKQQVLSKWIVLEADNLLLNGDLQEYTMIAGKQVSDKKIEIPLKDPTLLTQYHQSIIVADQSTGDMVNIDYNNFDTPQVQLWKPTALIEPIESIYKYKIIFLWASRLSLFLLLAPFIVLFLLYRMGYNLNQKI